MVFPALLATAQIQPPVSTPKIAEEQDYAFAYGLYSDSLYRLAADQFDKFLAKYPKSIKAVDASFLAVECRFQEAQYDGAIRGFERFVRTHPHSRLTDDAWFRIGESYFRLRKYAPAINGFKTVLEQFASSDLAGESAYWVGESYAADGDYVNAQKYYLMAFENYPSNRLRDYAQYALGWTYQKRQQYGRAIESYENLIVQFPTSDLRGQARLRIGECYMASKDYARAVQFLTVAVASVTSPDEKGEAVFQIGEAYYQLGDYKEARNQYQAFLSGYPDHRLGDQGQYALGWSYLKLKEYSQAIAAFDALAPGSTAVAQAALFRRGVAEKLSGSPDRARATWESILQRTPTGDYADNARYELGMLAYDAKDVAAAQQQFDALIADHPTGDVVADAHRMAGECLVALNQFGAAAGRFERALAVEGVDPATAAAASYQLAWAQYKSGALDKAEASFETFLATYGSSPRSAEARFWLAETYYQRGKFRPALEAYSQVLQRPGSTKTEEALYGAAWSHYRLAEYREAAKLFERLSAEYPKGSFVADSKLRVADCYYSLKEYGRAATSYRSFVRTYSTNPSADYASYQLGQASFRTGDFSESVGQFQTLLQKYPNSELRDDAQYAIGWVSFQKKEYADAIREFRLVLSAYPSSELAPKALYSIGDAYYNLKQYDEAERAYREVIAKHSKSSYVADAVIGLQYCLVAQNRSADAVAFVDDFITKNPNLEASQALQLKKAEIHYGQRQYAEAASAYLSYATRYPKSRQVPSALYWAARSRRLEGKSSDAVTLYLRAASAEGVSPTVATSALLEAAELARAMGDQERLSEILSRIERDYAQSEAALVASYMKADVALDGGSREQARSQFTALIAKSPSSAPAAMARLALARMALADSDFKKATDLAEAVSTTRTDSLGAEGQYLIGAVKIAQRDWEGAVTALLKIRYIFPNEERWMAESYLAMGQAYEALKEPRRAREAYQAVLRYPQQRESVDEAKRRLGKLETP